MTTTTAVMGTEPTFALTSSGGPARSTGHRRGAAAVDDGRAPARTVASSVARFVDILTRSQIIAAFGNDETALLLYDIATERAARDVSAQLGIHG